MKKILLCLPLVLVIALVCIWFFKPTESITLIQSKEMPEGGYVELYLKDRVELIHDRPRHLYVKYSNDNESLEAFVYFTELGDSWDSQYEIVSKNGSFIITEYDLPLFYYSYKKDIYCQFELSEKKWFFDVVLPYIKDDGYDKELVSNLIEKMSKYVD